MISGDPIYDETSPVPFNPDLSDTFAQKFDRLADRLIQYPGRREQTLEQRISQFESELEERPSSDAIRYLAVLEVLYDLVEIGYGVGRDTVDGESKFVVYPPDEDRFAEDPQRYKEFERDVLKKEQEAQFEEESIRSFIREMEEPTRHDGQSVSIESLVADEEALYEDLVAAREATQEATAANLEEVVQPYLQVADRDVTDPHTGLNLHEIWRYFRYTWLTPYNTVPGRNINFLVRDASREHHPVIGIASLASSMMNLTDRDEYIGWVPAGLEARLERRQRELEYEEQLSKDEREYEGETRTTTRVEYLETEAEWDERVDELCSRMRPAICGAIDDAIERIRYDDFVNRFEGVSPADFEAPDDTLITRLKQLEGKARYVLQGQPDLESDTKFTPERYDLTADDLKEVDLADEDPDDLESWSAKSETALFVRKRAESLQTLLRCRRYIQNHTEQTDKEFIERALDSGAGKQVVQSGLKEIKKRRVGACMMNVQVCGAVPPYNEILGGKLVAMALTGPKPINTYRDKYEGYTSKIASAMCGEPVEKPNDLVFLDTTGLFAGGSAQYDRIRVPTPNGQIEYTEVGQTSGYGSVQFGASTRKRLATVTKDKEGQQMIRGRFGEGIAPRLRKIRRGLQNLGLDGDLLQHKSPRVVYVIELAENACPFLRGETDDAAYYWPFDDVAAEQESIYDYWRTRWVSKRVQDDEVMDRIQSFDVREDLLLGPQIDFKQKQLNQYQ